MAHERAEKAVGTQYGSLTPDSPGMVGVTVERDQVGGSTTPKSASTGPDAPWSYCAYLWLWGQVGLRVMRLCEVDRRLWEGVCTPTFQPFLFRFPHLHPPTHTHTH